MNEQLIDQQNKRIKWSWIGQTCKQPHNSISNRIAGIEHPRE